MAQVPSSGFSFQDVVNVFGGSGLLGDYYRGGSYVPNIPQNYGIADNPANLALDQFANATNYMPMSGYITPNPASASGQGAQTVYLSCALSGGVAPYTTNWYIESSTAGGGGTGSVLNQSGFGASVIGNANRTSGGYFNGVIVCYVRDATGAETWIKGNFYLSIQKSGGIET